MRLLGSGTLRVQVVDGAGQPVSSGSVNVDGTAYPNTHRYAEITPGNNGLITFTNLPEGSYAVAAARFGLGGRVSAIISDGSTIDATVQLQATGSVEGHVYMPDGVTPIGLADVQLRVGGRSVGYMVTSEEPNIGKFSFINVPTGDFTLDVFDNHTGRVGRSAGSVTEQGHVAVVNVMLLPIGAVRGRVTANGVGVDHAAVNIYADGSGVRGANLFATTDPDGNYRFTGIPAGRFVVSVSDAPGGQTGSASGTITGTNEPLPDQIVNIALEPSLTVTGTVFQQGSTTPVSGAQITITVGGRVFHAATNDVGVYRLGFVPLGEIRVRAEAPVGYDRGEAAPVTGTQPGGTVTANVTLDGVGTISGEALDNVGAPLSAGTVTFTNNAWGTPVILFASVQPNGHYEIPGAPAGHFSLRLTVPGRVGVGSAAGDVVAGQTTNVPLQLEDAGTVIGIVKTADGLTPVQGASVAVILRRTGSSLSFYTHTNAQGLWTLTNVPLGTLDISVLDEVSGGIARATNVALATNGQTVDIGALLLDSTRITVVSVNPANTASGVPTNGTVITVTFSEPAESSSVNSGTVQLLLGSSGISSTVALASDGLTATLTPVSRLAETALYRVSVQQIEDRAGLRLANTFNSTFTTADETAPAVTAISPASAAVEVAPEGNIQVTFSEALDPSQNFANVINVASFDPPQTPLAGNYALDGAARVATFTPTGGFNESTRYTVTVNGQRDPGGNTQTQAFLSTFATQDRMTPVVDPLPIDGTTVRVFKPTITATYHDNLSGIQTSSVVLTLDNQNVTPNAIVTGSQVSYTPATPLSGGHHNVSVQVADNAGNLSTLRTASFDIDDSGPAISSFTIGGQPAVDGMYVTTSLQPVFAVSYTDDTGVNAAASQLLFAPQGSPLTPVPANITPTGLTYQPPGLLAEGPYAVQAILTNNLGTSSTTGVVNFTLDVDAPDIVTITPANGNQHGGTTVTITGARLLSTSGAAPTVTIGGNAAMVTSAVAGSPDQVVIVTPAGVAGPATLRMDTNRGTGIRQGGFNYDADPRTPFVVEPDTQLLWHMDETGNGPQRVLDVARGLHGTANNASTSQPGRFVRGRSRAAITADADGSVLDFGSSGYTVEFWMNTNTVVNAYTLAGVDSSDGQAFYTEFAVRLLPSGLLRAVMQDTARTVWKADLLPSVYKVDDAQWHYVAMTVDRAANRLSLYVDGQERAFAAKPANFGAQLNAGQPFRVGHYDQPDGYTSGPTEFPGILDEVRISSTSHSADKIQKTYLGTEGALGVVITNVGPVTVPRGQTTEIQINGYNLAGATATVNGAAPGDIVAQVVGSAATQARVQLTVSANAALADSTLVLSSGGSSASVGLRVVDLSYMAFSNEADTRLLWHLDEATNGAVQVVDSGNFLLNGFASSNSKAAPGRFSGGRQRLAAISSSDQNGALNFAGLPGYTLEFWMKTDPVTNAYTLAGKDSDDGYFYYTEYAVRLMPSGLLRAILHDSNRVPWQAELQPNVYKVDNGQWHYVAMVVDRTTDRLTLYVDGVERASSPKPSNFGTQLNALQQFRAGHYSYYDGWIGGFTEFPGTIDEIRVSATAHTAQHIVNDATGATPLSVTSYDPKQFLRDQASGQPVVGTLNVDGYNLDGITAQVVQNGQPVDVTATVVSSSFREAQISLSVAPTAPLGAAQVIISKPGQSDVSLNIRLNALAEHVGDTDTVVLWHLNEPGNGAVQIIDEGPLGINGTATGQSTSQPGHYGLGRALTGIVSGVDKGALSMTNRPGFTAEVWMKTNRVTNAYTIVGKDGDDGYFYYTDFGLRLLPSGALRAVVVDVNKNQWLAEMSPFVYKVDDNEWHYLALVCDRTTNKLHIYVDGVERASTSAPANFGLVQNAGQPLRAGHYSYYDGWVGGNSVFPGTLDEIRISTTPHSAERIARDMDAVPGLRIATYGPREVFRSTASTTFNATVSLTGWGLDGITARVTQGGQPVDATAAVVSSSFRQAQINVSAAATAPLGVVQLVVSKPNLPDVSVDLQINEKAEFAHDLDTRLLWHLNETGNGAVTIVDDTPLGLNGAANGASVAQPGHFGGGRSNAAIVSAGDFGALGLGSSSFTLDLWVKTNPVANAYTLAGKDSDDGYFYYSDFGLRLLPSGGLRAVVVDTNKNQWMAETVGRSYDPNTGRWELVVDNNEWHHLAMVCDRTANKLTIYVDGVARGVANMPVNFGPMQNAGQPFRTGHYSYYDGWVGGASIFPGTLDEIRLSTTAHSPARVIDSMQGTDVNRVTGIQPLSLQKATAPVTVTFSGYGLAGATATSDQPNVSIAAVSSSATRLNVSVNVPASVPVGQLHFTVTNSLGQTFPAELTIIDHQPFTNPPESGTDALVLWHLDETGNGAVHINGSGDAVPSVIGGTADSSSTAQPGHFGNGRLRANILSDPNPPALALGSSSFTAEVWMKAGPLQNAYTLVGKDSDDGYFYYSDFGLRVLNTGGVRAVVVDTNKNQWTAEMPPRTYDPATGGWELTLTDNQWHHIAMVCDRTANKLIIYVDGEERASSNKPPTFGPMQNAGAPLRAGHYSYYDGWTGGDSRFTGTLDEIRVLNYARTAAQMHDVWYGTSTAGPIAPLAPGALAPRVAPSAQPQVDIASIDPVLVERDRVADRPRTTNITVTGTGLSGVTARVTRDSQPLTTVAVNVSNNSDTQAQFALTVAPNTLLGPAQLVISKAGFADAIAEIRIVEASEFALEADTVGLWHLDEREEGAARLLDASDRAINLATGQTSRAAEGRFGGGRTLARASAEASSAALNFGAASFTIESWVKTDTLDRDYVLVGKETNTGQNTDFTLKVLASGYLRAEIYDTNGAVWQIETMDSVADGKWHAVAVVVDREAGALSLYIDGQLRAATLMPAGFAGIRNLGQPLEFGCFDADGSASPVATEREEFPGILDEIRISSTAHQPEKIAADFFGHNEPLVTLVRPAYVRKGSGPADVTLSGYALTGALVTTTQPGVTATVVSTSWTSLKLSVVLADSVPAEPIVFTITDALGRAVTVELKVAERLTGSRLTNPVPLPAVPVFGRRASELRSSNRSKLRSGAFLRSPESARDAKPLGGQR